MSNKTTRRQFVKNGSLIAGGLMAMPAFGGTNFFAGAAGEIKVALIGCGGRGTGAALQALSTKQNVKLVAMADAFKDQLDNCYKTISSKDLSDNGISGSLGNKINVPEANRFVGFDGYKKAIALADVVILTTPPGFRPIHFEEAVRQGKHIFTEKPMACDPAGIKKVLDAAIIAKQKKLNVVVGLQRRYQDSYRDLFNHKDLIGDIRSSQVWWNSGGVWVKQRQPGQTEMEYQMRNWYYFNWLCGDHISEQHIHNLDVMNWFKDAYPVKAQGMGGRQARTGKEYGEIYDHHYVEYTYADGSIMNSQCRHIPGTMYKVDELLVGTKGSIACDQGIIRDHSGKELFRTTKKGRNPYQTEHDELFEAIAKGEFKFADAEYGAKSTLTAIMGRMATYSGQVIEWDKTLNSGIDIMPKEYSFTATPPVVPNADGFYPIAMPGKTKYF